MEFFKVLSDIRANRSNFRQWEEDEADNDARRKALYEKTPRTKLQQENASKTGNTIIDVVTVMDQFSEDMSEDVEFVTQPVTTIAMAASFILTILGTGAYLKNIGPKILKMAKEANIDDFIIKFKKYTKRQEFEALFIKEEEIKKLKITEAQRIELLEKFKNFQPVRQKSWKGVRNAGLALATVPILTFIGATLYSAKFQIESSRIARYQARKKLEDPKYFVSYTEEQQIEAKKNLGKKSKQKEKSMFSFFRSENTDDKQGFFKNWASLVTQRKEYNKWKKTDTDDSQKVNGILAGNELKQAKADQDVIQRIVKKINNRAEEYSENMETSANVILGSSILLGPVVGILGNAIVNVLGIGERMVRNNIQNITKSQIELLEKELANHVKDTPKYLEVEAVLTKVKTILQTDVLDKYKELTKYKVNSKEYNKTLGALQKSLGSVFRSVGKVTSQTSILSGVSKWSKVFLVGAKGRKVFAGALGMLIGGFIASLAALKLQKASARAGRYNAREEFRENPQEFLSYDEEELNSVKDVKGGKLTWKDDFKEYVTFIPTAFKQMLKYENYKKTELKAQKELKEELIKLEVDGKQLQDAKNLQRKVFNTFEKVDEKSQEYSETMEAANEIAQPIVMNLAQYIFMIPFGYVLVQALRGKFSVVQIAQTSINFLAKKSHWLKSKIFKKQLAQMGDKAVNLIERQDLGPNSLLKSFLSKIGIKEALSTGTLVLTGTKIQSVIPDIFRAIERYLSKAPHSSSPVTMKKILPESVTSLLDDFSKIQNEADVSEFIIKLQKSLPKEIGSTIENILKNENPSEISSFILSLKDSYPKELSSLAGDFSKMQTQTDKRQFMINLRTKIETLLSKRSAEEMAQEITLPIGKLKELAGDSDFNLSAMFAKIKSGIGSIDEAAAKKNLETIPFAEKLGLNNISKELLLSNISKFEKIVANIPKEDLANMSKKIFTKISQDPEKFIHLLRYNPEMLKSIFFTPQLNKLLLAAGISWGAFLTLISYGVLSYFASLQKEAGRLGVMKALDELKDPAYYGNIIKDTSTSDNKNLAKV